MTNHQQQDQNQDQETMNPMEYSQKNPNLDTTLNPHHVPPSPSSSSQHLHHQQHMLIPNQTHEDKGFIFKNANNNNNQVMIKNPNFLSSSSSSTTLAPGEGHTMVPPPPPPPPLSPQHIKKTHHQNTIRVSNKIKENEGDFTIKNTSNITSLSCSSPEAVGEKAEVVEESGRDKLKRHRVEMAGRVRIPDIWGHEDLLKDWIDCTVFDSSLGNNSIMSARAALVQERRSTLRIQN